LSRHALKEALEDIISMRELESNLDNALVMDSGLGKEKAVCKIKDRYVTAIFVRFRNGIKIITCWGSSLWETQAYENALKKM